MPQLIIGNSESTERYIYSLNPVVYIPLWKRYGSQFPTDDARGSLCTITTSRWTPQGRYFDGANDYIDCNPIQAVDFTSGDFTLVVMVKGTYTGAASMMICQNSTNSDGWAFFVFWAGATTGNMSLRLNQFGAHTDISAVNGISSDRWQMAVVTRQGAGGQFYINGYPVATTLGVGLADAVATNGGRHFYIGTQNGIGNLWKGLIGDVIAFPRALYPAEIQRLALYSKGRYA